MAGMPVAAGVQVCMPRNPVTQMPSPSRCARSHADPVDTMQSPDEPSVLSAEELRRVQRLTSDNWASGDDSDIRGERMKSDREQRVTWASEGDESETELGDEVYYQKLLELKERNLQNLRAVEKLYHRHVQEGGHHHHSSIGTEECLVQDETPAYQATAADQRQPSSTNVSVTQHLPHNSRSQYFAGVGRVEDVPQESSADLESDTGSACSSESAQSGSPGQLRSNSVVEVDGFAAGYLEGADLPPSLHHDDYMSLTDERLSSSDDQQQNSGNESENGVRHQHLIDSMWDDFRVERGKLKRSAKGAWSPTYTIPEPFEMTRRTERQQRNRENQSRCILEAEEKRLQREQEELEAMRVRFSAKDVPGFVKRPIYESMCLAEEERRKKSREEYAKRLLADQQPFSFLEREQKKKEARRKRAPRKPAEQKIFRAKPLPNDILEPSSQEQTLEEELYRQIRMKIRSDTLLANSHLPQSMANRQKSLRYTQGDLRHKTSQRHESRAFVTREHRFRPRINSGVPDFGELHRRLDSTQQVSREQHQPTTIKPFFLRTEIVAEKKQRDREHGQSSSVLSVRPGSAPPPSTYVRSADSFHTRVTRSSQLRTDHTQAKLRKRQAQAMDHAVLQSQKEDRERNVRDRLAASMNDSGGRSSMSMDIDAYQKLQQNQAAQQAREQQYRQELEEMEQRLAERPLLLERTAQTNARLAAEHHFDNTLRSAGVKDFEHLSIRDSPHAKSSRMQGRERMSSLSSISD
eukprot:scpid10911/ scgid12347/ Protein FAM161A